MKKHIRSALLSLAVIATLPAFAQDVPAPGVSPRIDAIRKAGVLRVGVLANLPWLAENTKSDGGEAWSGPAWLLTKEYARVLGVKVEPVLYRTKPKSLCWLRIRSICPSRLWLKRRTVSKPLTSSFTQPPACACSAVLTTPNFPSQKVLTI